MSMASEFLKNFSDASAALVEATATRVVAVHGRDWLTASGIIVKPGVVVTAEETLERDDEVEVTLPGGQRTKATLAGRDQSTDVAVLRVEGAAAPGELATAAAAKAGALILSVGRT